MGAEPGHVAELRTRGQRPIEIAIGEDIAPLFRTWATGNVCERRRSLAYWGRSRESVRILAADAVRAPAARHSLPDGGHPDPGLGHPCMVLCFGLSNGLTGPIVSALWARLWDNPFRRHPLAGHSLSGGSLNLEPGPSGSFRRGRP